MVGALALGCVLAVPLGAGTARGYEAWREFADNISFHNRQHYLGPRRMGLQKLFAFDFATLTLPGDVDQRAAAYQHNRAWHLGCVALLVGLFGAVVVRRSRNDAVLLGVALCFFLLVLSRYYWSVWGLLLLLRHDGQSGGRAALSDAVVLLIGPVFYAAQAVAPDPYLHYQVVTCAMLAILTALLGHFGIQDLVRRIGHVKA